MFSLIRICLNIEPLKTPFIHIHFIYYFFSLLFNFLSANHQYYLPYSYVQNSAWFSTLNGMWNIDVCKCFPPTTSCSFLFKHHHVSTSRFVFSAFHTMSLNVSYFYQIHGMVYIEELTFKTFFSLEKIQVVFHQEGLKYVSFYLPLPHQNLYQDLQDFQKFFSGSTHTCFHLPSINISFRLKITLVMVLSFLFLYIH